MCVIIMNYVMYYDFDNFDSVYECIPAVRNGVAFELFDCIIKVQKMHDPLITFWVNGNDYSKEEAIDIFIKVSKLLSYMFALPIYSKENRFVDVNWSIKSNYILITFLLIANH